MLLSLPEEVREEMRSRYISFWGPLPVMIARIGGRELVGEEAVDQVEYWHNAERSRLKSSSGVQDVLLTSSFVFPSIIALA